MMYRDIELATGTGFVVISNSGPVLVTNRHNLTGRNNISGDVIHKQGAIPDSILIEHNKKGCPGAWVQKKEYLFQNELKLWREHPFLGSKVDVVALPLTDLADVDLFAYDFNSDPKILIRPSEIVSVIGFPFGRTANGYFAIWSTGFVASEPELDFDDQPKFLIDCRTRPGQSGSAVIAYRSGGLLPIEGGGSAAFGGPVSRLLGIYSGRLNPESDIGIVWKTAAISQVVNNSSDRIWAYSAVLTN